MPNLLSWRAARGDRAKAKRGKRINGHQARGILSFPGKDQRVPVRANPVQRPPNPRAHLQGPLVINRPRQQDRPLQQNRLPQQDPLLQRNRPVQGNPLLQPQASLLLLVHQHRGAPLAVHPPVKPAGQVQPATNRPVQDRQVPVQRRPLPHPKNHPAKKPSGLPCWGYSFCWWAMPAGTPASTIISSINGSKDRKRLKAKGRKTGSRTRKKPGRVVPPKNKNPRQKTKPVFRPISKKNRQRPAQMLHRKNKKHRSKSKKMLKWTG